MWPRERALPCPGDTERGMGSLVVGSQQSLTLESIFRETGGGQATKAGQKGW